MVKTGIEYFILELVSPFRVTAVQWKNICQWLNWPGRLATISETETQFEFLN